MITGGASGIGLALAERFGAAGARVVLADVEELAREVLDRFGAAHVLCPAFVKTRLMEHEPATVDDPIAAAMNQMLRDGVASGIPARDVADQVHDAVLAGRFWILTHPDARSWAVQRAERAAAQENPVLGLA